MRKINILTKQVYNRIAAGEVVDRPYSAVKELIENSLDAKASEIEIYIEKGGKQLIKVVDNGSGIDRDDMRAAFLPHATSKISCAEDLDSITTLGFRGEALASISAISGTEIVSVTVGNPAYKIVCEDGKIGDVIPAALEKGTTVSVRNLFYNTPVRAKFLKSDKKEETDITGFVTRYILGNPPYRSNTLQTENVCCNRLAEVRTRRWRKFTAQKYFLNVLKSTRSATESGCTVISVIRIFSRRTKVIRACFLTGGILSIIR